MNDKTIELAGKELMHIGAAEPAPTEYFDMDMLDTIPKDIGWMLLILGIIGIAVPGMVDIPLVIAGSIIIWPSTYRIFQRLARTKRQAHLLDAPVRFLSRFHADLEKRNPGGPQPVRSLTRQ